MEDKQKLTLALVVIGIAIAVAAFQMVRTNAATAAGETTIDYKVQPPPDSAPLPSDQGGTGPPTSTYQGGEGGGGRPY